MSLAVAICAAALATAVCAGSREVVDDLATLIENNYFDGEKARVLARDLRADARSGAFDSLRRPRDLATALTAELKKVDGHFNVIWLQAPAARASSVLDAPRSAPGIASGQSHGFRSVALLPGGIGYIEMRSFAYFSFAKPDDPARLAADAALQLVSDATAVILDLRSNIGGHPEMVGYLISAFTAPEADIYNVVHRREGLESERPRQHYRNPRTSIPLYVLVSGSTASAAESAAYTLQAAKRAIIVGERTSGAANPGGMFPVRDGFNVFVSTGTPINPITRTNWEGIGVQPDVKVASQHALQRAQQLALESLRESAGNAASVELQWVLEAMRAEASPRVRVSLTDYTGAYGEAVIAMAGDTLELRRGRRAALSLVPLRSDHFFVSGEPTQRVVFERDAAGRILGFQFLRSSAYSTWFPRR